MKEIKLFDYAGRMIESKKKSINLDPSFWFSPKYGGEITSEDVGERPYQYHAWTHACMWAIVRNISRLPLVLKRKKEIIANEQDGDAWGIFNLLSRPNAFQTRNTFIQDLGLKLLGQSGKRKQKDNPGGQVFIIPYSANVGNEKINLMKGEIPSYMLSFNNDYVTPNKVASSTAGMDKFSGWKFEVGGSGGSAIIYQMNEIIMINFANPYDILSGISSLEPATIALLQDIQTDIYNTRLYENNAIPTGILSSDQWLTSSQRKELLTSWYQNVGGPDNMQKTAILGKGLKYDHIGLTNVDMQYKEMSDKTYEKMLAAFGLNKIAVGQYEQINYATIKEGRKILWQDTYLPIGELILEAINKQWIQYIDKGLYLAFDTTEIEALKADYTTPVQAAKTLYDMGIPVSVACRINNIPLTEQDLIDYPYLAEKPERFASPAINPTTDMSPSDDNQAKSIKVKSGAKERFSLDYIERVLDPGEKDYLKMLVKFFYDQRNRMQDKVDEWAKVQKAIKEPINYGGITPEMFLLSIPDETKKLLIKTRPLVADQLERAKQKLEEELDGLVIWNYKDETIDKYVNARLAEMKIVNVTTMSKTKEKIDDAIKTGMSENKTIPELAKDIKSAMSEVGEIRKNQSVTIARTETGIINSSARFDAFKDEGIQYHEWVSAMDEKVRDLHQQANGQIVIVGQPFPSVGLRFPNDPIGEPENIINCRCVAVASEG